jgi:hypothetical protein
MASGLRGAQTTDRLRLAIDVADPAFADRIASVLADVEGLELVGKEDEPDALVVAVLRMATEPEASIALTGRELEVLALLAEGASNKLMPAGSAFRPTRPSITSHHCWRNLTP